MYLILTLFALVGWADTLLGFEQGEALPHIYESVMSSLYIVGVGIGIYLREWELNRLYDRIYLKRNGYKKAKDL